MTKRVLPLLVLLLSALTALAQDVVVVAQTNSNPNGAVRQTVNNTAVAVRQIGDAAQSIGGLANSVSSGGGLTAGFNANAIPGQVVGQLTNSATAGLYSTLSSPGQAVNQLSGAASSGLYSTLAAPGQAVQSLTNNISYGINNSINTAITNPLQQGMTQVVGSIANPISQVTGNLTNQLTGSLTQGLGNLTGGGLTSVLGSSGGGATSLLGGSGSGLTSLLGGSSGGGATSVLGGGGGFTGGFGYPVIDATGNLLLASIKGLNSSQIQILSNILGENRGELSALLAINQVLGGADQSGGNFGTDSIVTDGGAVSIPGGSPSSWSNNQWGSFLDSFPSLKGIAMNMSQIFPTSGFLDVFMGMKPADYKTAFSNPAGFASSNLLNGLVSTADALLDDSGNPVSSSTASAPEMIVGARIASMSESDRAANTADVSSQVGKVLTASTLNNVSDNAQKSQAFSAMIAGLAKRNTDAKTINERMSISNDLAVAQAQMAIDAMHADTVSNASTATNSQQQTDILQEQQNIADIKSKVGK